jgi:hypothetical protein
MRITPDGKQTSVNPPGQQPQKSFSKDEVDAAIKAGASKDAIKARIVQLGKNPADYGL